MSSARRQGVSHGFFHVCKNRQNRDSSLSTFRVTCEHEYTTSSAFRFEAVGRNTRRRCHSPSKVPSGDSPLHRSGLFQDGGTRYPATVPCEETIEPPRHGRTSNPQARSSVSLSLSSCCPAAFLEETVASSTKATRPPVASEIAKPDAWQPTPVAHTVAGRSAEKGDFAWYVRGEKARRGSPSTACISWGRVGQGLVWSRTCSGCEPWQRPRAGMPRVAHGMSHFGRSPFRCLSRGRKKSSGAEPV
jgi:hypothetical protein